MKKKLLVLCAALMLTGCGESGIDDRRNETGSTSSVVEETTINGSEVTNKGYDNVNKGLTVYSVEKENGREKCGIIGEDIGAPVIDGEVNIKVEYSAKYTIKDEITQSNNTYSIFLYHNGTLHEFNDGVKDTYMHTETIKNGEEMNLNISFKVTDNDEKYKVIGVVRNEDYPVDEYGEKSFSGLFTEGHNFVLNFSNNTKVFDEQKELDVCTNCDIEKINYGESYADSVVGKEITELKLLEYGLNSYDEFIYKSADGIYKYASFKLNQNQDYISNYTSFIVCDDEIYKAFDGKPILQYKGQGDICVSKDLELNLSEGEHVLYSVTIGDKGVDLFQESRSRFTHLKGNEK